MKHIITYILTVERDEMGNVLVSDFLVVNSCRLHFDEDWWCHDLLILLYLNLSS